MNKFDPTDNDDIIPTWTAVDDLIVKTPKELMENLKAEGWSVEYHRCARLGCETWAALIHSFRIPISQDRPIEDSYLDAYLNAIKDTDPLETPLVSSRIISVAGKYTRRHCPGLLMRHGRRAYHICHDSRLHNPTQAVDSPRCARPICQR